MDVAERIIEAKGVEFVRKWLSDRAVRSETGCLWWTLRKNSKGYGKGNFRVDGKKITVRPHRLAFLVHYGYLTPGLTIDHVCTNKPCIEPTHLEECSNLENNLRSPNTKAGMRLRRTASMGLGE